MSVRIGMLIVAFGLTFGASVGQANAQAQNENGDAQDHNPPTLPFVVPVDVIEGHAAAEARQRAESEATQREIDDLVAQQGVNIATQSIEKATLDMRNYAYWQTWFVGGGTALLIVTLYLSIQANKAAMASIKVAEDTSRDQTRAYVHVKSVRWEENDNRAVFVFFIENSGATPCTKYEIAAIACYVHPDAPSPVWPAISLKTVPWGALPGHQVHTAPIRPAFANGEPDFLSRDADKTRVVIQGAVRYETFFGESFESDFYFFGDGRGSNEENRHGKKMNRVPVAAKSFHQVTHDPAPTVSWWRRWCV